MKVAIAKIRNSFGDLKSGLVNSLLNFIGSEKYFVIQLDITDKCNLSCLHCYQASHNKNNDMDVKSWKKIFSAIRSLLNKLHRTPWFIICGGEPTISPNFKEIILNLKLQWPDSIVSVLSNGTTIDRSLIEFFKSVKGKLTFSVSIDGPTSSEHDFYRGKGSFDKTVHGVMLLKQNGFHVNVQAILSKRTSGVIKGFFALAKKLNVDEMNFTRFIKTGNARSFNDDRSLSPLELKSAYEEIIKDSSDFGIKTSTSKPLFVLIDETKGTHGKFGYLGFIIDNEGDFYPSSRMNYPIGNVLKDNLENLFFGHPVMKRLRTRNIEKCGECGKFNKCGGDRNAALAEYGNIFAPDPGCWMDI